MWTPLEHQAHFGQTETPTERYSRRWAALFVVGVKADMGAPRGAPGLPRGSPERHTDPQGNAKHDTSVDF